MKIYVGSMLKSRFYHKNMGTNIIVCSHIGQKLGSNIAMSSNNVVQTNVHWYLVQILNLAILVGNKHMPHIQTHCNSLWT